jgi:hypothetical protein
VRVHVGDGRDADARRLDDVDGVYADARADVVRRRGVVPRHADRDDGSDDAAILGPDAVYRQAVGRTGETRLGRLTALVGVGYFFVWTVFGMAAFPLGVALSFLASLAHFSVDDDVRPSDARGDPDEVQPVNWGNKSALLVGDFLLAKVHELAASVSARVSEMVARALADACEARVAELRDAHNLHRTPLQHLEILKRKASGFYELPCRIGALLGALSPAHTAALAHYGRCLSLAQELTDEAMLADGRPGKLGRVFVMALTVCRCCWRCGAITKSPGKCGRCWRRLRELHRNPRVRSLECGVSCAKASDRRHPQSCASLRLKRAKLCPRSPTTQRADPSRDWRNTRSSAARASLGASGSFAHHNFGNGSSILRIDADEGTRRADLLPLIAENLKHRYRRLPTENQSF